MLLLGDILRRQAQRRGDQTAYVLGSHRVSYAAFHARSNQLGRALRRLGVRRGDRVAVLANNCAEYPIIYFAALKLGAIVVPVNARFGEMEVAALLEHCEAATLVESGQFTSMIDALQAAGRLVCLRHRIVIDAEAPSGGHRLSTVADAEDSADIDADIDEDDPHVMLYTSGTTGAPKGTLLTHRAYFLQATTSHLQLGFSEDDTALSMFPMFHMGGWALPLGFWHTGATVVIMAKAEPRAILQAVQDERVTYLYAVPTVFESMLAVPEFEQFDLSSVRLIGGGTAAMTAAQVRRFKERFRCRNMVILYGSTESGPVSVLRPADVERKPETVGRPYLDVELRLLDNDREVPPGEIGEIHVRSEFIMQGYWRNPEETARTIRGGWVRTGDLGVFDSEGFLSIVGRCKEVIRSGGESIFPAEIERVLLSHPQVSEAGVVGIPDPKWGEAVVAAVVLHTGSQLSAGDLIEYVRGVLAGFKKPKHVLFFSEMPRTAASRQIHKPLLRELVLERLTPEENATRFASPSGSEPGN